MVAVLYRLRCRLRSGWRSTVLVAAIVAATGGIVVALVAGAERTLTASDRYAKARGGRFDTSLEQHGGRPRTAELEALPAVARIESATFVFGGLLPADGIDRIDTTVFAGTHEAFGTTLVDGREPDPSSPGEFVATRSFIEGARARLGDHFTLVTISAEQAAERGFDVAEPAGPTLTATLVGVIDGPVELGDPTPFTLFPSSMLDIGDVGVSATESVVELAPGATVADLRTQLDALPDGEEFGIGQNDWVPSEVQAAVHAQGQGLLIVAAIAAAATVVVVGQLLTRQVRLRDDERLVLRSLGMTRREIVGDQVLRAGVPVAVGAVGSVPAAFLASDLFPVGFARRVEPNPGLRFVALVHLPAGLAVAVLVLAWVLVALVVSERRRHGETALGLVDTIAGRVPVKTATALRFAFTRHARDASGSRAPVAGMVIVLAVLVGALTFGASLGHMVDRPAYWGANYDLGLGAGGGELPDSVRSVLASDPDVSALSLSSTLSVSVGTDAFHVVGWQPVLGAITPVVLAGRLPTGVDEIAIGRIDAGDFGVGVGDDLTLVGAAGSRTLRVTGLVVVPGVEGADGVGLDGFATFDALRQIDPSVVLTTAEMRLRPGASWRVVAKRITDATGMTAGPPVEQPSAVLNVARVRRIPYLVAATLAVLALLSLGHQLVVSTQRRRRDMAVLRALGADSRWVTGVVHWQATLFTAVVVAIGGPLGIVSGRVVYRAFVDRIGARDTVTLPFAALVGTVVVLLALANVVAAPSAHQARRRSPAGTLAQE